MPTARYTKKRKTRTRRYTKKRVRTSRKRAPQPNSLTVRGGLPRKLFTSSNYFYFALQSVTGTSNFVLQTQSSPFTCMSGVSNSQPLYFDTYKTLYNRVRVHGFKTTVTACYLPGATNTREIIFGIYNSSTASVPGTAEGAMQQPGAKMKMLPFDKSSRTLSIYNKCYYNLGVSKVMYNTDLTYQSLVSTVPSSMAYTTIWFYNYNGDASPVQYQVKVTLYMEYFEPTLVVNT